MRRVTIVVILPALVLLGACGGKKTVESVATPIAAGTDVSFESFLTDEPSASPSASAGPTSAPRSASSSGTRATARPVPAAASGGKTVCPSGSVTAELLNFHAQENSDKTPAPDGTQEYDVRASGLVRNNTNHAVTNVRLELTVQLDNRGQESDSITLRQTVSPGSQATWNAEFDFDAEDEPKAKDATLAVVDWSWGDGALDHCWSG